MSQADRDLVQAIRAELAAVDPSRSCDRLAESAGLGRSLRAREAAVARLAVRLGRETADAGRLLDGPRRTKHVRVLDAPGPEATRGEAARGGTAEEDAAPPASAAATASPGSPGSVATGRGFDWRGAQEHCRFAYLRGRFLARGSLSLASARSHLEFVVDPEEAPVLAAQLADVDLPASWRIRRGRGVVTWKSSEAVVTFLRRAGAGASLLELEARQVSRALRGDLNRVINAESANLQRAVAAAGRQLEAIDELEADGRLGVQPYVVRVVAEARRETPEATLGELAERLELHRSSVPRALERLERLALDPGDGDGRPRRRRPAWGPGTRGSARAGR